jgi:hypothetical protein
LPTGLRNHSGIASISPRIWAATALTVGVLGVWGDIKLMAIELIPSIVSEIKLPELVGV